MWRRNMPQTLTAKWKIDLGKKAIEIYEKYVNCIGNLTLTGYNSEMSNDSFEEKRGCTKSPIYISVNNYLMQIFGERRRLIKEVNGL